MENKRSLKYLIVSACLALLIASIGGIVVGASSSPADSEIKILGATLDINDEVAIGYVVDAAAVGYSVDADGNETVEHYVHIYDYNPTGTADEGTKLEKFVHKSYSDGSAYVIFLTDGYAVSDYTDDVYARVIEGSAVGAVRKAGVYELANLMEKNGSEAAQNLVSAVIKYHDAAYKVLNGTASPYKFVSVSDGYIVGEDGFNYTSGVYATGTNLTLADEAENIDAKGIVFTGWNNGSETIESSVVTVSAEANYAPEYMYTDDVSYNPYMNYWRGNYYSSGTVKNGNVGDAYWSAAVAGVKAMGEANAVKYIHTYQLDTHSKGFAELVRSVFRNETTGEPILKYSYTKTPPIYDETTGTFTDVAPGMGDTHAFGFENVASSDGYVDINFDVMFPSIDKDGDGVYNEVYADAPTTVTDDEGNEVTTSLQYGDWFTNMAVKYAIRFPIGISDTQTGVTSAAANLLYINICANVDDDGIVTGFYIGTSAGEASNQADKNIVNLNDTIYNLDEYYTFTARITADDSGAVEACTVMVNGVPVVTRTAAAGNSKQGLSYNTWDGTLKLTGDDAAAYVGFGTAGLGRYNGDYYIKGYNVKTYDRLTAADVEAAPVITAVEDNVFVALHSAKTTATIPGQSTLGNPIIGEYKLRSYNEYGSWVYDSIFNSYTIIKSGTSNPGAFNLFVTNPMNGLSETDRAGKAVAYEFKMTMPDVDYNLDGILSEAADVGRQSSSVAGHFTIGIGSGSNGNATLNSGMIGLFRVQKTNMKSALSYNNFALGVYGAQTGKLTGYSNDTSKVDVLGSTNSGNIVTVKIVLTPDETTGIVTKQETYINGVLMNTRTYDADANTTTAMNYPLEKISDTDNYYNGLSIYSQNYITFSYQYSDNALHNMMFADFNAYLVDATN